MTNYEEDLEARTAAQAAHVAALEARLVELAASITAAQITAAAAPVPLPSGRRGRGSTVAANNPAHRHLASLRNQRDAVAAERADERVKLEAMTWVRDTRPA